MKFVLSYLIFAAIATAINIISQDIFIQIYSGDQAIIGSIIVGTGAGLITKYILDKRFIFRFQIKGISHDTKIFLTYCLMGILTTSIFWTFEFGFHLIFETKPMRYVGGVIGLAIGYSIKYRLDKKYVFRVQET